MTVTEALLDSWDRQCRIVAAVASKIDESNRHAKPSEDGWPLDRQLAHMFNVRKGWLEQLSPSGAEGLGEYLPDGVETPLPSLDAIREKLAASGVTIREVVGESLAKGVAKAGFYDNQVLYLQHMVWHDGWHVGLIMLGLRLAGQEPAEEWEEEKIWGEWRTEEW